MAQIKTNGGKQQRERNGERDDQSAANIPQKEKENDHHQDDAFGQIMQNGVGGVMQEVAAIEERNDLDPRGQNLIVEFFDLGVNALQSRIRIIPLLQENDALDHIVIVDHLAVLTMNGFTDLPQADLRSLHHRGNVLDLQRGSVGGLELGLFNILDVAVEPYLTNVDLLLPLLNEAAAGIGVVVGQLLFHLADAQAIGDQFVGIDPDLVFAGHAPEAGDIHHAQDGLELLLQRPVLDRFELHVVVGGIGAVQGVPVDLPNRAPVAAHLRRQSGRQRDLREAFENFLTIPVVDRIVVENHLDVGETGE